MSERKTCILIAGMHRSGTSAIAGCYEMLGYNAGKTVMPSTPDNPKGYFENIKCWQLNEKLLSMLDLKWDSISNPDTNNIYIRDKIYIHEIEKIIAEDFLHAPEIFIKDPRISYLLPFWIEGLQFLNYEIKILIPFRNPESVCRSLHTRDGISIEKGSFIYARYFLECLNNLNDQPFCVIEYERFCKNPVLELQDINDKFGIKTPLPIKTVESSIESFVQVTNASKNDQDYAELVPPFAASVFQLLNDIRSSSNTNEDLQRVSNTYEHIKKLVQLKTFVDDEFETFSREQDHDDSQIDFLNELLGDLKFNYNNITREISDTVLTNSLVQYKSLQSEIESIKEILSDTESTPLRQNIVEIQNNDNESNALIRAQLLDFQNKLHLTTHSLNQHRIELVNIRASLSHRLGFALTWPIRKIYEFIIVCTTASKWAWTYLLLIIREKEAARAYFNFSNLKKLYISLKTEPTRNVYNNVARALKKKSGVLAPKNKVIVHEGKEKEHPVLCHVDETIMKDGNVFIRGWALSKEGIEKVDFSYEDTVYPMIYKFERQDLGIAYPEYKDSHEAGFFLFANVGEGGEEGTIKIYDSTGSTVEIEVKFSKTENFDYVLQHVDMTFLKTELQYPIWSMIAQSREKKVRKLTYSPLISIIMPVYNIDKKWLDLCLESVVNQAYENWELCIVDDASTNKSTVAALKEWEKKDDRINVQYGLRNVHISEASNKAIKMAKGEYIALMDHDDELNKRALFEVADSINKNPNADVFYSDEDKIREDGVHIEPHFKPDWSPETLENMMYVGHLLVIRSSIINKVNGFRVGYEGSQDYDLMLRISDITQKFVHIPKVLYHWRISESSSAGEFENKNYAHVAAEKAIKDYLKRNNKTGIVKRSSFSGLYEVKKNPDTTGATAIIIPFYNALEMTVNCVNSILKSTYKNFHVYLVSNNSDQQILDEIKSTFAKVSNVTIFEYDIPFNFSAINNWAVKKIEAEFLVFVNNDIIAINDDWIERMLEHCENPEIGAVGAKLLYEDDTIQHAGVIIRVGGVAGHGFRNIPDNEPGYCGYAAIYRNCAAVTGACLMVRKSSFDEVGGFNEQHLHVAYNDIDLCLKLLQRGYRNIYTPHAKLYHLESKTRPKTIYDMSREELVQFNYESDFLKNTYPDLFKYGDPYYNINLTLKHENYSLNI